MESNIMKRTLIVAVSLALGMGSVIANAQAPAAPAGKPRMPQVCGACHTVGPDELRGTFENVAFKSKALQLKIDNATEIVRFDEATLKVLDGGETKPGEALRDVAKGREARVVFTDKGGVKTASLISFKGPIKIAPDKLSNYAEVERLVALGPEKGAYTLIDSRPLPRVQEGTIPTAINLPYPAWDKFVDRLPKDKNRYVIFFCQGVTCMMSPNSMLKATALGYTNVKVYREGYPEWLERNIGVIAAPHLKEAWIDKQIPHVLVDARPASTAAEGAIPGAVSIPPSKVRAAVAGFPNPKLKAPVMVYDVDGGNAALDVARVIKESGQPNVTVIAGGFDAWKSASGPVVTGALPTQVAYVPKPRAGSIANEEFIKLASATPADVLILDVRNPDEANAGMIKGAMLIPDEELIARIGEVPKNKRIITHCSTGIRAEMAYHKLKQAGYANVGFLYAAIDIKKDGTFKVTPN
jgi:rhodanese-related sulfurtransferase